MSWDFGEEEERNPRRSRAPVQLRPADRHPFSLIDGYVPLAPAGVFPVPGHSEAVPVGDAAVLKLVRLAGGVGVTCQDKEAERALNHFLRTVPGGVESKGHPGFPGQLPGLPAHLWTGGGRDCPQPGWAGHCRCAVRAGVGCPG